MLARPITLHSLLIYNQGVQPEQDETILSEKTPARRHGTADILLLAVGILAIASIVIACAGLVIAVVWQAAPGALMPPSKTPTFSPARETATLRAIYGQTLTALPTSTPTIPLTPTASQTPSPTPIEALEDPSTPVPEFPAPWLVIHSVGGSLQIFSPAAASLKPLTHDPVLAPDDASRMLATGGRYAAYLTSPHASEVEDLVLKIINLPGGGVVMQIPLNENGKTGTSTPPSSAASLDVARSLFNQDSLAWSPDGKMLAFTGLTADYGADIFVLTVASKKVVRLGSLPTNEFAPNWSPDGRYLIFFSATGSGTQDVEKIWAADVDTDVLIPLSEPQGEMEVVLGWQSADQVLLASRSEACGLFAVRRAVLPGDRDTPLVESCLSAAAYDRESGSLLAAAGAAQIENCSCGEPLKQAGVYMLPGSQGQLRLIAALKDVSDIRWEAGVRQFFTFTSTGWTPSFTPQGLRIEPPYNVSGLLPVHAPVSDLTAWSGTGTHSGVWVAGPMETPRRIFTADTVQATWRPDGAALFFFSNGTLYQAAAPDFKPELLSRVEGSTIQAVWAVP